MLNDYIYILVYEDATEGFYGDGFGSAQVYGYSTLLGAALNAWSMLEDFCEDGEYEIECIECSKGLSSDSPHEYSEHMCNGRRVVVERLYVSLFGANLGP